MLYISLTLSAVLLGAVNLIVAKWRNPVPATIGLGIGFSVLPICMMLVFPAVGWQALVLTLLLFVLLVPNRGRRLYLPLSCVLSSDAIYAAFYDDDVTRGFLHSHSYTGSALACRAALATLDIFDSGSVIERNRLKATQFSARAEALRRHPAVANFRHLGMIWAFDAKTAKPGFAREFFAASLKRGVLLRPIGNTVYFMPPYVVTEDEFSWLVDQAVSALDEVCPQ